MSVNLVCPGVYTISGELFPATIRRQANGCPRWLPAPGILLKVPRCATQDFIDCAPSFNTFNVPTERTAADNIEHDLGKLWVGLSKANRIC